MSALGLAAIAANAAFDQNRVLKDREFQDSQRAYEQKGMDAQLSTLPERTEATRARAGLDTAQSSAAAQLLPGETANTLATQKNVADDLAFAAGIKPEVQRQQTAGLDLAGKRQKAEIDDLPRQVHDAHLKGEISREQMADTIVGTLGQRLQNNDKPGALRFANSVAKQNGLYPGTDGKTFTDIRPVGAKTPQGDTRGYELVASDGSVTQVPFSAIQGALGKMSTGQYTMQHTTDGSVYTMNEKTGTVNQAVKGDLVTARLAAAQQDKRPSVIQVSDYLLQNGIAKTAAEAYQQARTLGSQPRNDAILDMAKSISTSSFGQVTMPAALKQATETYDQFFGAGSAPGLSNSKPNSTITPQVESLFPPPN